MWANINKWYDMSVKLTTTEDKEKTASMEKLNLDALRGEIDELMRYVDVLDSPIVFAHNDVSYFCCIRYLNILSRYLLILSLDFFNM